MLRTKRAFKKTRITRKGLDVANLDRVRMDYGIFFPDKNIKQEKN